MADETKAEKPSFVSVYLSRRKFLEALGYTGAIALPGASGALVACSSDDSGGGSIDVVPVSQPTITANYAALKIQPRSAQISNAPPPPGTNSWSYCVEGIPDDAPLATFLGPTFEQRRNVPLRMKVTNLIPPNGNVLPLPPGVAPFGKQMCGQVTLQSDVGVIVHLHGGRVQGYRSETGIPSDGWPLAPMGCSPNPYGFAQQKFFDYPNDQRATMLWYHDHAMDNNATHVYAGLVGLYLVRDQNDDALLAAVGGSSRELIYVIQDRIFDATGQHFNYSAGTPNFGNYSRPEFLGNALIVNGRPTTATTLPAAVYRLRLLNGCNARTIALALVDMDALARKSGRVWYTDLLQVVGGDGGLLGKPWHLAAREALVITPAQRRDVLIDLTALPAGVGRLRLVNVSLASYATVDASTPEAIYTTYPDSVLSPSSIDYTTDDSTLYGVLVKPLGIVADFTISKPATPPAPLNQASVDAILEAAATDDDFVWNGSRLTAKPGIDFGPNRLILLMSDTMGYPSSGDPATTGGYTGWSDVQLFELTAGGGNGLQWNLPLDVNLTDQLNPPSGAPTSAQVPYTLSRSTFFASATAPDVATTNQYPPVHAPTITPKAGTYERWYVANVGNPQPLVVSGPDMHPFHVHLVNFVVLRHWKLVGGSFELVPPGPMDGSARQDTLQVPSDSLYEILLYFPPGYSGTYVYHCHILEHEDKCMMSTFTVT